MFVQCKHDSYSFKVKTDGIAPPYLLHYKYHQMEELWASPIILITLQQQASHFLVTYKAVMLLSLS